MPTEKDDTEWAEAFEADPYRTPPAEKPQTNPPEATPPVFIEGDIVALTRDLPALRLRAGAIGAIVGIYETGGHEVAFTTATGRTLTVVPLLSEDLRPAKIPNTRSNAKPENQTPQCPGRRRPEQS